MEGRTLRLRFAAALLTCGTLVAAWPQPASAYYDDIHYALTYYLARAVGYTPEQSFRIASANSSIDWSPDTEPVQSGEWYLGSRVPAARAVAALISAPITQVSRWRFHAFRNELAFTDPVGDGRDAAAADAMIREQRLKLWSQALEIGNPGILLHFFQDEVPHARYGTKEGHWPVLSDDAATRTRRFDLPIGGTTDWLSYRSAAENDALVAQTAQLMADFMKAVIPSQRPRPLNKAQLAALIRDLRAVNPAPPSLDDTSIQVIRDGQLIGKALPIMELDASVGYFANRAGLGPEATNNILRQLKGPAFRPAVEKVNEAFKNAGMRADCDLPFETIPEESMAYTYDGLGALKSPADPFVLHGALTISVHDSRPQPKPGLSSLDSGDLGTGFGGRSSGDPSVRSLKVVVKLAKTRLEDEEYVLAESPVVPDRQPAVIDKLPIGELVVELMDGTRTLARETTYLLGRQRKMNLTTDGTSARMLARGASGRSSCGCSGTMPVQGSADCGYPFEGSWEASSLNSAYFGTLTLQRSNRPPTGVDCASADAYYDGRLEFPSGTARGDALNMAIREIRFNGWVRWPADTTQMTPASVAACRIGTTLRATIHPEGAAEPAGVLEFRGGDVGPNNTPGVAVARIQFGEHGHNGSYRWTFKPFVREKCDDVLAAAQQENAEARRTRQSRKMTAAGAVISAAEKGDCATARDLFEQYKQTYGLGR